MVSQSKIDAAIEVARDKAWLHSDKYRMQVRDGHADSAGASPALIAHARMLMKSCSDLGIPMYVHTWWRTPEQQRVVVAGGFSKTTDGPHMHGMAYDLVHGRLHWELPRATWEIIGALGNELARRNGLPIKWGGEWSDPWDPAHWQIANWRDRIG